MSASTHTNNNSIENTTLPFASLSSLIAQEPHELPFDEAFFDCQGEGLPVPTEQEIMMEDEFEIGCSKVIAAAPSAPIQFLSVSTTQESFLSVV